MKKLLPILFLFSSYFVLGQSYTGKVVNSETKQAIPFADIWIIDLGTGTTCNGSGEFNFNFSLPNLVHLKVSAMGYNASLITLKKEEFYQATFYLEEAHIELQEMEVSESTGLLQNYSITNVTSKTLEELNTIPSTTLGQTLENISGVYSNSTGNGINKPVIRGLSGMRVSTFLNGLKIENQQWGVDHGIGIDAIGVDKIEVIKGPSSLLFGSDALGGVLYIKEEDYARANTIEASVNSQFESNTLGTTSGFGFKMAKNNVRFNLFGNFASHADYQIPSGEYVLNSRFNSRAVKAAFGYNKNNWIFNVRYTLLDNELGIPGHSHDSIPNLDGFVKETQGRSKTSPLQVNRNHYLSVENKLFFKNSDLKLTLGAISHHLQEFEKVSFPSIDLTLTTYSYNGLWTYKKNEKHQLLLGAQGNFQLNENSPDAEDIILRNITMTNHGGFAMLHSKWNSHLQTQFGVRGDMNHFTSTNQPEFDDFTATYQSINYSLGISYTKNKYAIRGNISSGYRPPHPVETLANGVHHASRRFEIGRIDLKPEYASQLDVSFEYNNDHVGFVLNPFVSHIQNYVYVAPQDSVIDGYLVVNYEQNESTWMYGGELAFHYHPHFLHNLHFESNLSYLFAENQNNQPISFIPQPRLNTLVTYELNSEYKLVPARLSVQHSFFDAQNRVISNEIPTGAFQLLNVGMDWNLKIKQVEGVFKCGVRNLTNTRYVAHLSELKPFDIPNPGRNIYFSLTLNINSKIKNNEKIN